MKIQYLPIALFMPLMCLSYIYGYTPLLIAAVFFVISIITFTFYYKDKSAAINGTWRTPENTLHFLSLVCGWPGALVAQQTLRHKIQKKSFRLVFWLTVIINIAVFGWLHTQEGAKILRNNIYKLDNYLIYNPSSREATKYIQQLTKYNAKKQS